MGLIIFDRGFNNRKYFTTLLAQGHQLLCRARKNAAFYYLPTEAEKPRRGKRLYGPRAKITHWRYRNQYIPALKKVVSLADQIVRTKMCPQPVRLVVVRTRPKAHQPYRYFMV